MLYALEPFGDSSETASIKTNTGVIHCMLRRNRSFHRTESADRWCADHAPILIRIQWHITEAFGILIGQDTSHHEKDISGDFHSRKGKQKVSWKAGDIRDVFIIPKFGA